MAEAKSYPSKFPQLQQLIEAQKKGYIKDLKLEYFDHEVMTLPEELKAIAKAS